ncbi:glycosyltransferase [Actinomadura rifamycini]|uniref:glycosyltransferase n=1 Tax=Actinomadura rifamycini TaxID=31962 RepID=UPI000420501E|nr:glycosyltransferase [Actinomadura rifamycini]
MLTGRETGGGTAGRDVFVVCNSADGVGGVQRWAHHTARLFAERGDRVTLVGITAGQGPAAHDPAGAYRVAALHGRWRPPALALPPRSPRARLDPAARGRDAWRSAAQRRGAARLSRLLAAARPGAVVIVAQVWAMEWVRLADTSGLRVVGMTHESFEATRRSSRYGRVREHYAHADRLLALTAEDADAWARAGMTNAGHVPNPLHVEPTVYPTLDLPAVACVGRLSDEKGVDLLLEAWARARERRPGWRLHVYGTGPDEEALRRRAAEAGLADTVEFRGVVADVEDALVEVSVFALPSRAEGFPMSVLEAMAYGLPTVAFDCAPGVRALLEEAPPGDGAPGHGASGLLVPPGDTAAFAEALGRLMDDPDLCRELGANARASVRRFRPEAVLAHWDRLFDLLHRDLPAVPAGDPAPTGRTAPARDRAERRRARRGRLAREAARGTARPAAPAARPAAAGRDAAPALEGDSF